MPCGKFEGPFAEVVDDFRERANDFAEVIDSFRKRTNDFAEVVDSFEERTNDAAEVVPCFRERTNGSGAVVNDSAAVMNDFPPVVNDFAAVVSAFGPVVDRFPKANGDCTRAMNHSREAKLSFGRFAAPRVQLRFPELQVVAAGAVAELGAVDVGRQGAIQV